MLAVGKLPTRVLFPRLILIISPPASGLLFCKAAQQNSYLLLDKGRCIATASISPARDELKPGWGEIISLYVLPGILGPRIWLSLILIYRSPAQAAIPLPPIRSFPMIFCLAIASPAAFSCRTIIVSLLWDVLAMFCTIATNLYRCQS